MSEYWTRLMKSWHLRPIRKSLSPQIFPLEYIGDGRMRSEEEIFQRIMGLFLTVGYAKTEYEFFQEYPKRLGITEWLTDSEKKFLFGTRTEYDFIQKTWQAEALFFLMWVAGLHDRIGIPTKSRAIGEAMGMFPEDFVPAGFLKSRIKMRPVEEIEAWATLLYRMHSLERKQQLPSKFDSGIILEWFRAANWLLFVQDESDSWDDVDLST